MKRKQEEEGAERQAASQAEMEERLWTWRRSLWQRVLGRSVQVGGGGEEEEEEARRERRRKSACIVEWGESSLPST